MSKQKINVAPAEASITSIILMMLIGEKTTSKGSKLDILEDLLKKTSYDDYQFWNPKSKHAMKMMRISYKNWKSRVFRYEDNHADLKTIRVMCENLASKMSKYFTELKNKISQYLKKEDCEYTEILAYICTITSMIVFANDYCALSKRVQVAEMCQTIRKNPAREMMAIKALDSIRDEQFKKNVESLYPLCMCPDGGIDVNSDEKINTAMVELADALYLAYINNFTEKREAK